MKSAYFDQCYSHPWGELRDAQPNGHYTKHLGTQFKAYTALAE